MNAYDDQRFGLILLTTKQVEALRVQAPRGGDHAAYFDASYEDFASVGPGRIDKALARYLELGLLDHLGAKQKAALARDARRENPEQMNDLLQLVPDLVARAALRRRRLQPSLRRSAPGSPAHLPRPVRPVDIVDGYSVTAKNGAAFGFRLGGRNYSAMLKSNGKWVDLGCWNLIERAVKETKLPGRFYPLDVDDYERGLYIYLTPAQHDALVKESLAKLADEGKPFKRDHHPALP
jgi:hypothetical protein